ncbi:proline-rich nuclear receptor coactivator 1 [Hoplias malabaricus]|uniref:proline-rich nuclear receptor coactivator 1 n=1 Tax=Hoplias malabaricus TaxID=27720 RepID=UPI003462398B
MYPPLLPCGGFEIMLGETLARRIEPSLEDVENSKPPSAVIGSSSARSNLNASRRALLKKGARRVRTASVLQSKHGQGQQQHLQKQSTLLRSSNNNNNTMRLSDINNNNTTETPSSRTAGGHLKTGAKKELLKIKTGRVERGNQSNGQSIHSLNKHDQSAPNLNTRSQKNRLNNAPGVTLVRKSESSSQQSTPLFLVASRREGKRPLSSADASRNANVSPPQPLPEENLKDGEKTYAGAKFSEPPSPSVLPKPPSHWVGENSPKHSDSSREQMSVHLKTLLKVQAKP